MLRVLLEVFVMLDMLSKLHGDKTGMMTAVIARREFLAEDNRNFMLLSMSAIMNDTIYT
jgi:hypothetical protein